MDGIFNSETPSFVPENDILGIGQIDKENFGLGGDRSFTSNYPGSDFSPVINLEDSQASLILNRQNETAINPNLLLGISEDIETDSDRDFLTGNALNDALPKVRELLQSFAGKPDFEAEMELAFGNSYDAEKADVLKAAWSGGDLGFLPKIEILNRDLINGAKGAFAGETETIYLARDFVRENLGDVGEIIPVIVEEFGHYLDGEINSIDAPGDEGEIFASFVLGEELSLPEFWGMKVEDDGAIGFLDGRMVSIENAENVTQKDTLNFSAGNIRNWSNLPIDDTQKFEKSLFKESLNLPQGQFNFAGGAVTGNWELKSGIEASVFATVGSFGIADFSYPVDLFVSVPESVESGETFTIKTGVAQKTESAAFGSTTKAAELPNAGLKFNLDPLSAKIKDVNVKTPLGEFKNVVNVDIGVPGIQKEIDVLGLLKGEVGDPLDVAKLKFAPPEIKEIKSKEATDLDPSLPGIADLPAIVSSGTSNNIIEGELDLDRILALSFPPVTTPLLGLGGGKDFSLLGDRIKGKLSYELLDIKERLGLALQQEFTFDPDKINVTMALDEQTEQTGAVGEEQEYTFTAPSDGTGILEIKAEYELTGNLRNVIGVLPKGSIDVTALAGEASLKVGDYINASAKLNPLFSKQFPEGGNLIDTAFPLIGSPASNDSDPQPLFPILNTINTSDIDGEEDAGKNLIAEVTYYIPYNMPVSISDSDITLQEGNDPPPGEGKAYFKFGGQSYEWESYTVQPGDTLSEIALNTLGSASPDAYNFIAFHNDIADPDLIFANTQVIQVPTQAQEPDPKGYAVFNLTQSGTPSAPAKIAYKTEDGSATAGSDYLSTSDDLSIPAGGGGVIYVPIVGDNQKEEPQTEDFKVVLTKQDGTPFADGVDKIEATGTIVDDDKKDPDPKPDGGEGSGHGDPHLVTFDGLYYDFQAAGEFVVAKSDSGDLEIQARQRPFVEQPLSVNTAVATKIGDQRIGFYAEEDSLIRIDGQPVEIPDNQSIPVGEGQISRDGRVYTVVYPTGEQLEVNTALTFRGVSYLNYNIFLNEDRESTISGILGNNNGNTDDDIILADGTVLEKPSREELYGSYADSWRVTQESSLFDYEPGRSTDSFTINGFPTRDITVDDLDPADVARARELIGDRITDPALINATIIDLVFSDFDESFIESAEQVARTPEASIIIDIEPEAVTDTVTTASNTPTTINILANDISTPGLPVSLETFDQTSAAGGTITRDDSGTPDDASDDLLAYAPPANFSGSDSFQYTINDGERTATGLVTIIVPGLNLANLDGNNGFVLDGINPGNFSGVAVSKIGDFNGDSIDDLSIGAFAADPNGNNAAGESYVIFGTNNGFPANLDLTNLDGSNGLTLQGIDIQGLSGGAVGGAGDINNDGIDDLIIGAFGAPANGNNNAGKAYVVFGNSGLPANIDLANLNGSSGFVLSGLNEFDYAGVAVGGAGDINNDGIDDLYISAPGPLSSPPSKTYIVFGSETDYPANIDLSALNGSTGFVINDSRGLAGSDVSKAGDINNDGIADLIIGADVGSGDSYVVYGSSNFPATVELSGILNGTNGSQLAATDILNPDGTTVRGVGDVNNDGIDDLMVAVSGTTPVDNLPITKGYVVFGGSLPSRFDLSALNGSNGFVINDFSIDNILGFSIGEVGDFNRDGIDDILIGTSQADANGNIDSGKSYVVFGDRDGNFPTNIDLARLDSRDGLVLNGAETEDLTGSAVDGAGDLNNDGISDLIVGAPGSLFNDAPGKSYVVFGSGNFGSSTTLVFDELYYLSQNPEVADLVASGALASGLEHFTRFGVGEDRDFRVLLFNENSYLTQNPEVASLVASGELRSGLEHFTRFGQFEERSAGASEQSSIPLRFDENYYLNQNPEVREAVEAGLFSSGFDHYIQVGQFQGRLTSA